MLRSKRKTTTIITAVTLSLCTVLFVITELRYRAEYKDFADTYTQVTARLSQRTDYTDPDADDNCITKREYLFRYVYDGEEYLSTVVLTNPERFPLSVGDTTEIFVKIQKPNEIYYPKKSPLTAFIERLRNIKNNDKAYR